MANDNSRIAALIAAEIGARAEQAAAAIQLLDEGSTVPFIARYRKEVTGGLDDTQLRQLAERLIYLRELNARRAAILDSIREQGKLTDALEAQIVAAVTKAELEDLYLPYKPKRRTRAEIARERGLGPLAEAILADRALVPAELAKAYVVGEVTDVKMALEGARDIVTDTIAVNSELVGKLRAYMQARAVLRARVVDGKQEAGAKFSDYFDHAERWADAPSHRALAMLRGRNEGVLSLEIEVDADSEAPVKPVEAMIAEAYQVASAAPGDLWLRDVVRWTWRVRLSTSLSLDLMMELHDRAEQEAIKVFARNLKDLLLAAPAGSRPTLGLDPGIRTGVKVAVIDATGKVLETTTVYPFPPRNDIRGTQAELARLIVRHRIELIAIGNGSDASLLPLVVERLEHESPLVRAMAVWAAAQLCDAAAWSALTQRFAAKEPDLDVRAEWARGRGDANP